MCLGIPARIVAISDAARKLAIADVCGVQRETNIACVLPPGEAPESLIGTWVLLHVGFAMSRIDEEEARRTLEILIALGETQAELESMRAAS